MCIASKQEGQEKREQALAAHAYIIAYVDSTVQQRKRLEHVVRIGNPLQSHVQVSPHLLEGHFDTK